MRLIVGAIGKLKRGPEAELVARYQKRAAQSGRPLGLSGPDIIELPESRADTAALRKSDESQRLLQRLPDKALILALDEGGKAISSRDFASIVTKHLKDGRAGLALLIGGPDGHGDSVLERAAITLSFGKLTMPHQIVRILIMEQLYRATTIAINHPYHRD
ncbi:MAG: 23S rRNA (pseudouridine(1915)-N(3))-methyltransferase RlmH [Ahrensia sp.]|nr:23S rRNA (pseudouridine(1915)-N(3))-methyltransferase RlmH [Ahrensia sp.]